MQGTVKKEAYKTCPNFFPKLACTPSFFSSLAMDFDRVPLASIMMTFESPYKSRWKTQYRYNITSCEETIEYKYQIQASVNRVSTLTNFKLRITTATKASSTSLPPLSSFFVGPLIWIKKTNVLIINKEIYFVIHHFKKP